MKSFTILFDASLSEIMDDEMLFLCFSFPMAIAMRSHLLDELREYPIAIGEYVGKSVTNSFKP